MSLNTPINGLTYPELTDIPNGPSAIQTLATQLDTKLVPYFGSAGSRDAAITAPVAGLTCIVSGIGMMTYTTEWVPLTTATSIQSAAAVTAGNDTTTSATYVDMAGTGAVTSISNWVKYATTTRIRLRMDVAYFNQTSANLVAVALKINGTDYTVAQLGGNGVNIHAPITGAAYVAASAVPSGTYSVQARWKRVSGTGTPTRDTNDWLTFEVQEVI